MTSSEMLEKVKSNLKLEDDTRNLDISDVNLSVCDYCNLSQEELPDLLEPIIRKRSKESLSMRLLREPVTSRIYPASRKEMEASRTPQMAVTAVRVYMVCLILIKRLCAGSGG